LASTTDPSRPIAAGSSGNDPRRILTRVPSGSNAPVTAIFASGLRLLHRFPLGTMAAFALERNPLPRAVDPLYSQRLIDASTHEVPDTRKSRRHADQARLHGRFRNRPDLDRPGHHDPQVLGAGVHRQPPRLGRGLGTRGGPAP